MTTLGQEISRIAAVIEDPDDFYIHHVGMGKRLTLWFKGDGRDAALASQMLAFMKEARKELDARYRTPIMEEMKAAYADLGVMPDQYAFTNASTFRTQMWLAGGDRDKAHAREELKKLSGPLGLSQELTRALIAQIQTLFSLLDALDNALLQVDAAISEFYQAVLGSTVMQRVARRDERIAALAGHTAEGIHYTSQLRNAVLEISGRLKAIATVA